MREGDEVFHRALDDLEPVQRGGAAVDTKRVGLALLGLF